MSAEAGKQFETIPAAACDQVRQTSPIRIGSIWNASEQGEDLQEW
jgi:hypothetical protein